MRIAQIAPLWERVPPARYGGTERVIYHLTEGLVARGHEVTLFATADARTSARLVSTVERPLRELGIPWDNHLYPLYHLATAFEQADAFDILHAHLNTRTDYVLLVLAGFVRTPTVITLHCRLPVTPDLLDRRRLLEKYRHRYYVSISQSQRTLPDLNYVATVYNGIDTARYAFSAQPADYVAWVGRICDEKGTREAILAARQAGVRLILAGKIDEHNPAYLAYYREAVAPLVDGHQIVYAGELDEAEVIRLYQGARAVLNPIKWSEPFGLVMAEAMSCGTPVIAFPNGAAPELIRDGETGFLVRSVEEMATAIGRLHEIDRRRCRAHVEAHFSVERMVDGYEAIYRRFCALHRPG